VQLGPKMAIFEPQQDGQTLTKFKNILSGVYWDQYQGFKTPVFWLNVFFQKATPPYWARYLLGLSKSWFHVQNSAEIIFR
jgi:hypothetical protein